MTLWELLFGERPFAGKSMAELAASVIQGRLRAPNDRRRAPTWLRRVCERGLARTPAERWPSMQVLLAELERGQARARMRGGAAAIFGLAVVGALAFGYRQHAEQQAVLACEAEGASIDEVWNDDVRERVRAGLRATKLDYAETTVEKLMPYLDAHADAWREQRTIACRHATVEHSWNADTLDRATWCLDDRRIELASLIDQLEHADAVVLQKAVSAAAGLGRISPCTDRDALLRTPSPPLGESRAQVVEVRTEVARAESMFAAGKYSEGLAVVVPARERAAALDWPPLSAEAQLVEAMLLERAGEVKPAEERGIAAYMQAAKAGAWDTAADAALRVAYNAGVQQARSNDGRIWAGHAEVAMEFAGDTLGVREAQRLTVLGTISELAGELDEARTLHGRALTLVEEALGPQHPDVASIHDNLGNVEHAAGNFDAAKQHYEHGLSLREQTLGSTHPDVARSFIGLGALAVATKDFRRPSNISSAHG